MVGCMRKQITIRKIECSAVRKIGKREQRRIERGTIWCVTSLDSKDREQFLGAYPSPEKAEEALREEFRHRRQPMVCGYDAARLGIG